MPTDERDAGPGQPPTRTFKKPFKVLRTVRSLVALMLLALLAGCATPAAQDTSGPTTASATVTTTDAAKAIVAFPVSLSPEWVRPGEPFTASATATATATGSIDWFLAKKAASDRDTSAPPAASADSASLVRGPGHEGTDETEDEGVTPFPSPKLALGRIESGASRNVTLTEPGLYRIGSALGESTILVSTRHDLTAGVLDLASPATLGVAPGAVLTVKNGGTSPEDARLVEFATPLLGSTATIHTSTRYQGELDVIARAADGSTGRRSLLVDALKPDPTREYAPFTGTFEVALAQDPNAQPKAHKLPSDHPIRLLTLTLTATSQLPVPAGLRVLLQDPAGAEIASLTGTEGTLDAADLPAGQYTILVHGEQGVLVDYEIRAVAELKLERPADAAPAERTPRGGGPINPCDPDPIPPPGASTQRCL